METEQLHLFINALRPITSEPESPMDMIPTTPLPLTRRLWLGLSLAACLCLSLQAHAAKKEATRAMRDFLPPVASINLHLDAEQQATDDTDVEAVSLVGINTPTVNLTPKADRITGSVKTSVLSDQIQTVMQIQRKVDEADLEYLWRATVEKNPVIRFSLEKLAAPADLHPTQSSQFLKKVLSTTISGATLASTMLPGGGAYRNMGTMAVGNALQNLADGRTQPTAGSLSETEKIQMAGLVDELKMKLLQGYQDYKNTLQALAEARQLTLKNNNLYSKALASKNDMAAIAAGTIYYRSLINETALRQKAKLHRMALERLAGPDAVSQLVLTVKVDESTATANEPPAADKLSSPLQENTQPEPLLGPAPMTTPSLTPIGPEPFIGPELPPATSSSSKKPGAGTVMVVRKATPATRKPATMPLDLLQPMELSPTLRQDSQLPDRLPEASRPDGAQSLAHTESTLTPYLEQPLEVYRP